MTKLISQKIVLNRVRKLLIPCIKLLLWLLLFKRKKCWLAVAGLDKGKGKEGMCTTQLGEMRVGAESLGAHSFCSEKVSGEVTVMLAELVYVL